MKDLKKHLKSWHNLTDIEFKTPNHAGEHFEIHFDAKKEGKEVSGVLKVNVEIF